MPKVERNKKWYEVYYILRNILAQKFRKNPEQFPKELYNKLHSLSLSIEQGNWLFNPHSENEIGEEKMLDPIQVFSWINDKRLDNNESLREKMINMVFLSLGDKNLPVYKNIDFSGCPAPITFKQIGVRPNIIQRYIWDILNSISEKSLKLNIQLKSAFKELNNWYGLDIPSFTIFLFWIDSDNYLSLDSKTVDLLISYGYISQRPKKYLDYKVLIRKKNTVLYRKLVENANNDSTSFKKIRIFKILGDLFTNLAKKPVGDFGFGIIGLSVLNQNEFSKVLKLGKLYRFYQCFEFSEKDDIITYSKKKDVKLFNTESVSINISAIVGKNGSGKSTLTDLILVLFNNLSCISIEDYEENYIDGLEIDMYIHMDTMYKIELRNEKYEIFKYQVNNNIYKDKEVIKLQSDDLFYNIILNYSHFALNANSYGMWLNNIYWKNDAYQLPIVLNPMRSQGNFDINKENELVKNRLLSLILEPNSNTENSIRFINTEHKFFKSIRISVNKKKFEYLYKFHHSDSKQEMFFNFPDDKIIYALADRVLEAYGLSFNDKLSNIISKNHNNNTLIYYIYKYIYKKVYNIARVYTNYKSFFNQQKGELINLDSYLERLSKDNSHITFKLIQTLNFIKYNLVEDFSMGETLELDGENYERIIEIESYSQKIQNIFSKELRSKGLKNEVEDPIYYIPPPFLNLEIKLNDDSDFEQLSSGEKQFLYSTSTFLYHIKNLNSVKENSVYKKYDSVNIIIDEIEMYFHPEMQRGFVKNVIERISKLILNDIRSINIIFITHSPFILSDIPAENVVFLDLKDGAAIQRDDVIYNSFGGNITDILRNPFFLSENGIIGEFASKKINEVIKWINDTKSELLIEKDNENKYKLLEDKEEQDEEFKLKFDYYNSVISVIGEKVIRYKLEEMLSELELLKADKIKDKFIELKSLERKKESIQNQIDKLMNIK